MKRIRTHRWIALALFAVSVSGLAALETMAQAHGQARGQIQGQFFGFGEYTGGTLHTVFELQAAPSMPPRQYTTDITPWPFSSALLTAARRSASLAGSTTMSATGSSMVCSL